MLKRETKIKLLEYMLNFTDNLFLILDNNKEVIYKNFSNSENSDLQWIVNQLCQVENPLNWHNSKYTYFVREEHIWEIQRFINVIQGEQFEIFLLLKSFNKAPSLPTSPSIFIVDKTFSSTSPLFSYFRDEDIMKRVYESVYQTNLEKTQLITIVGEFGSGRSTIACTIFRRSFHFKNAILVFFDCPKLNNEHFNKEISLVLDLMKKSDTFVFYFHDLYKCSKQMQNRLYDVWTKNRHKSKIRLLISLHQKANSYVQNGLLIEQFSDLISEHLIINVPPLRERKNVLESLCNILIYQYNLDFGYHVIGFEPGTMDILKQFNWPQNIHQLKSFVLKLVIQCKSGYITQQSAKETLLYESDKYIQQDTILEVDVSSTLQEINHKIIDYILQQEDGNQTRAAKRLGISRSTMWRMIK